MDSKKIIKMTEEEKAQFAELITTCSNCGETINFDDYIFFSEEEKQKYLDYLSSFVKN